MEVFGPQWAGYTDKIEKEWRASISQDDLVLIPGDISWAMHPEEARPDLEWIGNLPLNDTTKLVVQADANKLIDDFKNPYHWAAFCAIGQ